MRGHLVDWPASRRRGASLLRFPWLALATGIAAGTLLLTAIAPVHQVVEDATADLILAAASPLAPEIDGLAELPAPTLIVAADGRVLTELVGSERHALVTLDDVPLVVRRAVLAAEDREFYGHAGVDSSAVIRAALHTAGGDLQGASTITQQLAKLNYTGGERTVLRKFREVQYAIRLEERYSKGQLLERYLNQVYFGEGAYGIGAAAQTFFGVAPRDLTPAQAATLAVKIRAPERLDPRTVPTEVIRRRDLVLAVMAEEGWLSPAEEAAARAEPLVLAPPRASAPAIAPHFVEHVKREALGLDVLGPDAAARQAALLAGGLRIETTLDARLFDATVAAVGQILGAPGDPNVAVASVEPGTGAIRSLFGGLDFATTQYDVASVGARQTGSAFKPFAYLAALQAGIDPRSVFDGSSPQLVPCYGRDPVDNYAGEDAGGAITLADALVHSVNTVFAQLSCHVSPEAVLAAARSAGVPEGATNAQPAIFLGGLDRGVSALTLAGAYATFATTGTYAEPYSIARILDRGGRVVYERAPALHTVFHSEDVRLLNAALVGVVRQGTGRAANIGRPVAGKTGTTQHNVDAWFAGFVPQLATAVWAGYEPGAPMTNVHGRAVTGGRYPAQIFAALMKPALEGVPVLPIATAAPGAGLRMVDTTTTTAPPPVGAEKAEGRR